MRPELATLKLTDLQAELAFLHKYCFIDLNSVVRLSPGRGCSGRLEWRANASAAIMLEDQEEILQFERTFKEPFWNRSRQFECFVMCTGTPYMSR